MGISPPLSVAILSASLSTQITALPFSARHAPTTRPTYPVPITPIFTVASERGQCSTGVRHGGPPRSLVSSPRMHVGFDLRPSLLKPTGVGAYVLALAQRMPRAAPHHRFYFFSASLKDRYPK